VLFLDFGSLHDMHFKFPEEFKSIFDHIGVRYYKALNQKLKIELQCQNHVGDEVDMNRVKSILENLDEPIIVVDMD
jgi:predicted sulfurtransferase